MKEQFNRIADYVRANPHAAERKIYLNEDKLCDLYISSISTMNGAIVVRDIFNLSKEWQGTELFYEHDVSLKKKEAVRFASIDVQNKEHVKLHNEDFFSQRYPEVGLVGQMNYWADKVKLLKFYEWEEQSEKEEEFEQIENLIAEGRIKDPQRIRAFKKELKEYKKLRNSSSPNEP